MHSCRGSAAMPFSRWSDFCESAVLRGLACVGWNPMRPYFMQFTMKVSPADFFRILAEEAAADFSSMELLYPDEVPVFDKYDEYLPTELVRRGFAEGVLHTAEMRETVLSWRGARIDSIARA